jgi:hypothetical protein
MLSPLEDARDDALAERLTEELYMVADDIMNPDPPGSPGLPTRNRVFAKPLRRRWRWGKEYLNLALKLSCWAIGADHLPRYLENVSIGFFFWSHSDAGSQAGTSTFAHPWH